MKYKTLFRLLLKFMGLWLVVQGVAGTIGHVALMLEFEARTTFRHPFFNFNLKYVIELIAGLYLFFGGKWILNLVIPSNRPYCPECGYDLSKASASECPECGTPIEKR